MAAAAGIKELYERYCDEFATTGETLRRRFETVPADAQHVVDAAQTQARQLAETLQPRVEEARDSLVRQATDLSPPQLDAAQTAALSDAQLWTAVCLVGVTVGQLLGRNVLAPLHLFDTWVVLLLAFVALPAYFYLWSRKTAGLTDKDRRWALLALSAALGLLTGYNLSARHLAFWAPIAWAPPLLAGVSVVAGGAAVTTDRRVLLGAVVAPGLLVHLLLFVALPANRSALYLVWAVAVAALGAVNAQLQLARLRTGPLTATGTLCAIVGALLLETVLTLLLGRTAEQAVDADAKAN